MRILFVDASRNGWGTEQHLVSLAGALAESGHTVSAVVKRGSPVERLLLERGVRTYATAFRGGADPRGVLTLINAIRRDSPDWVVTNRAKLYWTVWLVARLMGVSVALFRHLPDIRRWLTRCMLPRLVDRFFVVSEFARERLVAQGAPTRRIGILYNPIDTDRLHRTQLQRRGIRQRLGILPEDFVVGFVGRVERDKGVRILWDALAPLMAESAPMRVLCVGDGTELGRWQQLAQEAGLGARCHFVGWTASIGDFYLAMDLLVAPSVAPETFCRVIAEAQASGLAVIGTRIGGIPEAFVPDESGLLVEPHNGRELQSAIRRLYDDRALCARFAATGRRYARRHFASQHIAEQFVAALGSERSGFQAKNIRRTRTQASASMKATGQGVASAPVHAGSTRLHVRSIG
jgi:glycosyltransferase involved in cell wall biosynthesis